MGGRLQRQQLDIEQNIDMEAMPDVGVACREETNIAGATGSAGKGVTESKDVTSMSKGF